MTTKNQIELTKSLSFSHNKQTVDVHLWDVNGDKITTVKNSSSELFLEFFYYGCTIYAPFEFGSMDDEKTMVDYLKEIL